MKQTENKKLIVGLLGLVILLAVFGIAYKFFMPKGTAGGKAITFEVIVDGKVEKSYSIKTDEEFLRGALEKTEGLEIKGDDGEYGLFVKEINGRMADDTKQEWWAFTKKGEMLSTGVDSTPIADGDKFEATLTVAYICQ